MSLKRQVERSLAANPALDADTAIAVLTYIHDAPRLVSVASPADAGRAVRRARNTGLTVTAQPACDLIDDDSAALTQRERAALVRDADKPGAGDTARAPRAAPQGLDTGAQKP